MSATIISAIIPEFECGASHYTGHHLALSFDSLVRVYSIWHGVLLFTVQGPGPVDVVMFSPDSRWLAVLHNTRIHVVNAHNGVPLALLGLPYPLDDVAWCEDSSIVVGVDAQNWENEFLLIHMVTADLQRNPVSYAVTGVACSSRNELAVSSYEAVYIYALLSVDDVRLLRRIDFAIPPVSFVGMPWWSEDGRHLVAEVWSLNGDESTVAFDTDADDAVIDVPCNVTWGYMRPKLGLTLVINAPDHITLMTPTARLSELTKATPSLLALRMILPRHRDTAWTLLLLANRLQARYDAVHSAVGLPHDAWACVLGQLNIDDVWVGGTMHSSFD